MVSAIIDWPNVLADGVVGFMLGIPCGVYAHALYDRYARRCAVHKTREQYGHLAGSYVNYRIKDAGVEERTGGTIRLTFQKENGSFKVEALHSTGDLDWEGTIKMDPEVRDVGYGNFKYPGGSPNYGTQQVMVIPETESLHVITQNISHGKHNEFRHHWKRKRD